MTEAEIHQEMQAIAMTIRSLNGGKTRGRSPAQAIFDEIRKLEKRHADLAKMLQKYQLAELKGKTS